MSEATTPTILNRTRKHSLAAPLNGQFDFLLRSSCGKATHLQSKEFCDGKDLVELLERYLLHEYLVDH